jgi:hypothetical protein
MGWRTLPCRHLESNQITFIPFRFFANLTALAELYVMLLLCLEITCIKQSVIVMRSTTYVFVSFALHAVALLRRTQVLSLSCCDVCMAMFSLSEIAVL